MSAASATAESTAPSAATKVTHDVTGKVCIVTGANSGIGRVTALELARAGGHVFVACRSEAKAAPIVAEIIEATGNKLVEFLALDLASLASVRSFIAAFLARELPLHILVANAGVAGLKGQTADGFEMTIGVNHLGHFLLVEGLLEAMKSAAPARIVIVASQAHKRIDGVDLDLINHSTKSRTGFVEYSHSKAMNVLYTRHLAKRLEGTGVTTYTLHPGVVASSIWRKVPQPFRWLIMRWMLTNEEGAMTQLHCATAPELAGESGLYYDKCKSQEPAPAGRDDALGEVLYHKSLGWAGLS